MSRRTAWLAVAGTLPVLAMAFFLSCRDGSASSNEPTPQPVRVPVAVESATIELFFPGPDDRLHSEERELPPGIDSRGVAAFIAEAIVAGPTQEELVAPFPTDVHVGSVDISEEGVVYVDLESESRAFPPASGSRVEMLTLYSLVNSIVHNVEPARLVVVLWNGRQLVTFGGHIDTTHPVQPQPDLLARQD